MYMYTHMHPLLPNGEGVHVYTYVYFKNTRARDGF